MTTTRVRRTFVATPVRSASATWGAIVDAVASEDEDADARTELLGVTGVAASLIAAEAWRSTPAIVSGVGPQVRIYCLYNEEAIVGDDANEDGLSWSPTAGDWIMELPCPPEDLAWVQSTLAEWSDRIRAIDATAKTTAVAPEAARSVAEIDVEGFLRG